MARLRSHKQEPSKSSNNPLSGKQSSRKQAVARAGTKGDARRDADEALDSEPSDPSLVQDVTSFLKNLTDEPVSGHKKNLPQKVAVVAAQANDTKLKREKIRSKKQDGKALAVQKKEDVPNVSLMRSKAKFLVTPTPQWYASVAPLPSNQKTIIAPSATQLSSLVEKASSLFAADVQSYASASYSTSSASDAQFLQKVLQSGTLSDRLSSMTLIVQASPLHNIKALENLKNMAERGKGKGGREVSLKALRCIIDWWIGGGAPDRKLKYFRDQPLLHPNVTDQHLLVWYFEDWLKKFFFSVLQILETLSLDPLVYVRTQSLSFVFTLLRDKPEQEQNLLRLLVNKLGDTEKAICSRVSYHLLQLLQGHPSMKSIVVREIISLILKAPSSSATASSVLPSQQNPSVSSTKIKFADAPSTKTSASQSSKSEKEDGAKKNPGGYSHAQYYAAITFNQIVLSPSPADANVAKELIDVYFELFKEIIGEGDFEGDDFDKGDGNSAKSKPKGSRKESCDKKKKKGKEIKGEAGFTEIEDSNSRLVSAILTGVNRALPFAKMDVNDSRFNKHIDTLFLITHQSTFNISLQALLLIFQITTSMSSAPSSSLPTFITDRYYRTLYASLFDSRLSLSSKQAMYLNLLFKSLKVDKNGDRVQAFVRRFIQVLVNGGGGGGAEFIVGGLYLLGELFNTIPGLRDMLRKVPASGSGDENEPGDQEYYDPRKRDPQYAHASSSPLWELLPLVHHYHPTVSLNANQLLTSQPLTSTPDLSLNTLSHFLDRFVFKNPKQKAKAKGSSAMQPAAGDSMSGGGVRLIKGDGGNHGEGGNGGAVNNETWWRRRAEDIPIDQLFLHKYFNKKNMIEKTKAAKVERRKKQSGFQVLSDGDGQDLVTDPDDGSDNEDEGNGDEAEIWKAMKASMPDLGVDDALAGDSDDEVPSGLDGEDDDDENDNDEDQLSLVEESDADDLIPFDEALANGFVDSGGSDAEQEEKYEEWGGVGSSSDAKSNKRKRGEEGQRQKKKLRSLPTFASYEEYAEMIEDGPEDDI